jgi:hypothetical protein
VSSGSGIVTAWQPSFSLVRGPFSQSHHYTRPAWSVDPGSVSFTLDRYGHLYPESDTTLRDRLEALHSTVRPADGVVIQLSQ